MKKLNKLFAILFAVLGVTTLKAQTDVTSLYLTNPGFEETKWEYAKPQNDRAIYKPKGWSIEYKNGDANDMTYVATSMNQDGKTWNAKEGNSFFTRQRWANSTITLYQTLTNLLPGKYTLTFDAALFGAGSSVLTVLGTETEVTRTLSVGKNDPASWTSITQDFEITSETPNVTIKIASTRNGNNFKSGYDNFRLSYDGTSYYNTYIATIETLYNENRDWAVGVSALEEAIANAKIEANKTEAISELEKAVDAFRTANSIDMTSKITNPNFDSNISGWITSGSDGTWQRNSSSQKNFSGGFIETWRNAWGGTWNHKNFDIHQDLTGLPNGEYTISANIIAALQGSGGPYLRSKNEGVWMYGASGDENNVAFAATEDAAATWGEGGKLITVRVKVTDGKLTIGTKAMGSSNGGSSLGTYCNWFACDNWRLSYMGFDPSTLQSELMSLKEQATTILQENNIPSKYKENLQTLVNKEIGDTKKELDTSIDEITLLLNNYESVISAYSKTQELITICEKIQNNSQEFVDGAETAFSTAVNTAKTDVEAAATADVINAIYNTLESARQTYVKQADPTNGVAFDYTFLVVNPGLDDGTKGWTSTGGAQNKNIATNKTNGIITGAFFENWNGSNFTGEIYQTISNLPSGIYKLKVAAFGAGTNVYANDKQTAVTTGDGAWYEVDQVKVGDGTLKFGIKNENATNWMGIDNASLEYYGFDVPTAQSAITSMVAEAGELVGKPMNAEVKSALETAIDGADATKTTRNELNSMIDELNTAIASAKASIAAYVNIKKYIDHAKDFDTAGVLPYENRYNNGEFTTAGEETVRQELNVMTANYVAENFKNEIGLTNWGAESNAMWSTQGEHWDGIATTTYYDANGTNTTHTLAKTVELTPGTYVFRAAGRSNTNTTLSLSIDIDGIEPAVFHAKGNTGYGIATDGTATFDESADYARNDQGQGWEWQFIKFTLTEPTTVTLTATCKTDGWGWASFGNNGLWMDDATYVIANASALTTPLASAKELVEKPMGNKEKDALTSAITQAEGEITTPIQLDEAVEALNKAINGAKPSIETYATIKTYIDKADKIDASIAADYKSQYDNGSITETATNVFQALEVATYNYVTENFNYAVPISSTWNSTGTNTSAKEFNNEHWSGETRGYMNQNDDNGQGWNASAWSLDFDQDVTLPAGEYVFKVAGRKSADATLELVVTMGETILGTVSDFPNGSVGLGINKAGEASFDPNDQFARGDNTGCGWQWRYVKFTLDNEATVKIAVHAETNVLHNWVSFGDYTLQMTEDTYLDANMGALDAPTAAAEALVDTKPMGEVENQALKDALGMTYTTGAELKTKITVLETAVTNANAWVVDYNKAKAPLVAALERFETDYNDGANGCLYHLQKAAWSTVIEKVQAAAEAKDVTNSYAGFQTAADNLNVALDAAQTSINMYANFAAEISYAKAYTPIVTENAAAHNAAITTAEDAYKAAEIDDASELIRAMQNFRVIDYEYVSNYYKLDQPVELNGEWTGDKNTANGQHWKGDNTSYYDYNQSNEKPYEATITVTLQPGEYVLMAAGRAQTTGSSAYIKVNDKLAYFAAKGNTGYGIDTDGKANFSSEATYANDNKGRGWEYRFIEFTLIEETEVTLVAGMQIGSNSWASVCTPVLYTTPLDAAKNDLQTAIKNAKNALSAYPVGEEAFQVSETSELYVALKNAIATAQNVLDNATTADALTQAIEPLNTAVDEYTNGYVLNAPKEGVKYQIAISYAGYRYDGSAFAPNADPTTGIAVPVKNNSSNVNYWNDFTFTPVNDIRNGYTISITSVDGTTYYLCTGKQENGSNENQIRMTTYPEKALTLVVKATTTDGIYNLLNTRADNATIGCQDDRNTDGGLYTTNAHNTITITEAVKAEVTLKISSVGWATLILPFNAELPKGVVAYESNGVEDDAVQLVSSESLVANTPYLIKGTEGTYNFSGYGLAAKDSYTKNLFVGTYVQKDAERGSYVLQNKNGVVAFYQVNPNPDEAPKVPTVGAYRSYMQYTPAEGQAASPMFRIGGSTGIDNATLPNSNEVVIYDLMGRKVTTMEKGNMYIINGRKVIVK